jgi:cyclopropane fatty-acyl-phospholipid synthase-like methyltransferase
VTSASASENIVRYYDECASDYQLAWDLDSSLAMHIGYWDWSTWTLRAALARHNRVMADFGHVRPGDDVLDAGCGVGGSSIFLARELGCQVTGVTLSPTQARLAQANAQRHGVAEQTAFCVMDYSRTAFPGSSFDVVWALESSCYAADKAAFVKEAFRLLRPGGRLVISDGFATRQVYDEPDRTIMKRWLHAWALDHLATLDEMHRAFDAAGFVRVRFADIMENVAPSAWIMFLRSVAALPVGRVMQAFGLRTETQQRNIVGGIYQQFVWSRGLARYCLFCARKPAASRRRR